MKEMDNRLAEMYQEMAAGQGLKDSLLVTIFAKLYFEPEAIAMDDLAKETGYSLASISNKIKLMGPLFNLRRIKKPGTKKIYLYMDKDILKIWKEALLKKDEFVVQKAKEKMPGLIKEYKEKAKTEKDRKKMECVENYYSQILRLEKALKIITKEIEKID